MSCWLIFRCYKLFIKGIAKCFAWVEASLYIMHFCFSESVKNIHVLWWSLKEFFCSGKVAVLQLNILECSILEGNVLECNISGFLALNKRFEGVFTCIDLQFCSAENMNIYASCPSTGLNFTLFSDAKQLGLYSYGFFLFFIVLSFLLLEAMKHLSLS